MHICILGLPTVSFSQSEYVIDPVNNVVQPVLVIDKPSSQNIIITFRGKSCYNNIIMSCMQFIRVLHMFTYA